MKSGGVPQFCNEDAAHHLGYATSISTTEEDPKIEQEST